MDMQDKRLLWDTLEQHQLPPTRLLYGLSGLLSDDILRFKTAWEGLSAAAQLQLVTSLSEIAEADFEIDFTDIFNIALDSELPEISITGMEGLSECEDIRLIPRLKHILLSSTSSVVRAKAAESLAGFVLLGEFGKIRESLFLDIVGLLITTTHNLSEDIEVRRRALEAVAFTNIEGIPELIQAAYNSAEGKMQISAVFAMGRSADVRWLTTVRKELNNLNPEMRFEATRACGEFQATETISDLIELIDDVDCQVQEMAIWSLGQIGGQRARQTLEKMLESGNEALQSAAQQAIDELNFYQTDSSTFLGPPSDFSGEGEDSWFTPEGFMHGEPEDEINDYDDENLDDFLAEEN